MEAKKACTALRGSDGSVVCGLHGCLMQQQELDELGKIPGAPRDLIAWFCVDGQRTVIEPLTR